MTIKIVKENNVPPPPPRGVAGAAPSIQSHFDGLSEGESLFVKGRDTIWASRRIHQTKRRHPERRFTSRKMDGGVRIWRLADDLFS